MKRICTLVCAALMTAALCGCAAPAPAQPEQAPESIRAAAYSDADQAISRALEEYNAKRAPAAKQAAEGAEEEDPYAPLSVAGHVSSVGSCYVVYPQVQGVPAADAINREMCRQVEARAQELGVSVFTEYRVEYNRNGIFSVRIFLYDLYGQGEGYLDCIPLTFNAETGALCGISDFFDVEDNRWRGSIPDMITAQAENEEMVLLNDLLPISDDQQFYIAGDSVVIMYDLYEISVYSAGEPEFSIPVGDLAEYIDDGSPLNVMLSPSPEPVLAAAAASAAPADSPQPTAALEGEAPPAEATPAAALTPEPEPSPAPEEGAPEPTPAAEHTPAPTPTPTPDPAATPVPAQDTPAEPGSAQAPEAAR